MNNDSYEVAITMDPITEGLLRAEARRRGVQFQQILEEKIAAGLDQSAGDFSDIKRPSKGQHKH